ncbi:hypothetical protein KR032_000985, partial [Drosophila birchii]
SSILGLNQFCYFALFKQIRLSCEQTYKNQALDDLKYMDLKNFLCSYPQFRPLFYEWDMELSKRLFLLDVSSLANIYIDFAELYERLKGFPEKVKKVYWKSLNQAIEENDGLTSVELRYYPKTHYSEHMDVFESVMKQLRAKKGLEKLKVNIAGYTLNDLTGFGSLEELHLDVNVDIEELTECCRNNERISSLMVSDQQSGGRRLTDIVPFCYRVRKFAIRMKFDCDASVYAPFAKLPNLKELHINGEHERGTLQALFKGLARHPFRPRLSSLFVDDTSLVSAETTELSRIMGLKKLRYKCVDPQSMEPLAWLFNLKRLEILSQHDFKLIGDQICRILQHSKIPRSVFLPDCLIRYDPTKNDLLIFLLQNNNAADYSSLLGLPKLNSLKINGHHEPGTLVGLFDELARVEVPILTIGAIDYIAYRELIKRGWEQSYPGYTLINAQEIVALSRCNSIRRLNCGILDSRNIELLAKLSQLTVLTITTLPANGSLVKLFTDMAASNSPSLLGFTLTGGKIDCQEASALAQIGSLEYLDYDFSEAGEIELFSSLGWANLQSLSLSSKMQFKEISDGILKVSKFCGKLFSINNQDVDMWIDRQRNHIYLIMKHKTSYSSKTMLNPLTNLEWVESLSIDFKPFNLCTFFKAISTSKKCQLKKIHIQEGFLDSNETEELGKIKTLKEFHGKLTDTQSLEYLCHLSYLKIEDYDENRFPKRIVPILDSIEEQLTINLMGKEVSYNINTGHLILSNAGLDAFFHFSKGVTELPSLAMLKSLQSVRIFGIDMESCIQQFLSQLAARQCQTLQELVVENEGTEFPQLTISPSELEDIASIKSLTTLKCGFSEAKNIELIAGLPQLTELVITTHPEGSLEGLLRKINAGEELQVAAMGSQERPGCSRTELFKNRPLLKSLIVKGAPIKREEVNEIRKMKSLQKQIYRFDQDPSIISDLVRLSAEMQTLVITSREHSLADFEDNSNADTIARLPQDFKRDLFSFNGFDGVVQYLDRHRVVIELPPGIHCLKFLFEALALNNSQNFQQLVIRHRYIGLEEASRIADISSLKRLMCGLEDSSGLSYLCNLKQLKSLEFRSMDNFRELSHHLLDLLQSCKALESIDLDFSFPLQYIDGDFLLPAATILKSVRNPRTQTPLKLRFNPKKRILKDPVSQLNHLFII